MVFDAVYVVCNVVGGEWVSGQDASVAFFECSRAGLDAAR